MNKKIISLLLIITCCLSVFFSAGCTKKESKETAKKQDVTIRIGGLSGPTSMGLVKLMEDSENKKTHNTYKFSELSTDPSAFVAPLAKGELDIAMLPSNLASTVYNNTQGGIKLLAINTLGVLNIITKNVEGVSRISDLKGKTILASGQGATPEWTLNILLKAHGIDPEKDVNITWYADTTQVLANITNADSAIAMLPEPFVSVAKAKDKDIKSAIDFNEVWTDVFGSKLITGVAVARKEFAEENPDAIKTFMKEYKKSIEYVNTNEKDSAKLIEKYIGIKEPIAKKAIAKCCIVYETGEEMKTDMSNFLQRLSNENLESIGKSIPSDGFYYQD